jgi:hypothetical protein
MINLKEVDVSPNIAHSRTPRRTKALTHPPGDEQGLHVSEKLQDGFGLAEFLVNDVNGAR